MKIKDIHIDGFGIWSGLELHEVSDELTVFFGRNEAGKTTLMQFIRTVLYGFSAQRRSRYLPPVLGGSAGGGLAVETAEGPFEITRGAPTRDAEAGTICVHTADGTQQGRALLNDLLGGVDEATFSNVFAVGLRELQELGTLEDTAAAEHLYKLTTGLDRVSLVDVLRELEQSRNRLVTPDDRPAAILDLLARRAALQDEIARLNKQAGQWAELASQRLLIQQQAAQLQQDTAALARQARLAELGIQLRPHWVRRQQLDAQLAALPALHQLPEQLLSQLERLNQLRQRAGRAERRVRDQRRRLRAEATALEINQALWANAPRIEAMAEHSQWIVALQSQIERLQSEVGQSELELQTFCHQPGLAIAPAQLPRLDRHVSVRLRAPAAALRAAHKCLQAARQEQEQATAELEQLDNTLTAALQQRNETELNQAVEQAGQLVAQLRRRVQLEDRLEQMTRHRHELQEQSSDLLQGQVLPVGVLFGVGALFIVGVLLILMGLFGASILGLPSAVGWALAILGMGGTGVAVATKLVMERSAARQLEACHRQLELLESQVEQAKQDRTELDAQLPVGGGPLTVRLKAAETELRQLEELAPLDVQQQTALQRCEAAETQVTALQRTLQDAQRRWRAALSAAGLPETLTPPQVRQLGSSAEHAAQLITRLEGQRSELAQRQRELIGLTSRVAQLYADAGMVAIDEDVPAQLRRLSSGLAQQQQQMQRRQTLRRQDRRLKARSRALSRRVAQLHRRRRRLLVDARVSDEDHLRHLLRQQSEAQELHQERARLHQLITSALAGHCGEEQLTLQLQDDHALQQERCDHLTSRVQDAQATLNQFHQRLGAIGQEMQALVQDRRLDMLQLELGCVDARLNEGWHRWRVVATTLATLEQIRHLYETERQPEALREASDYLSRITDEQYRRIWTPLDEEVLLVENDAGQSLRLEVLSRGTREAVFISLRLALAAAYARRAAVLPVVLDDILVNLDAQRAKATATVLRDFARQGHQVLLFTCHEHIMKLFKAAKVPVRLLPVRGELSAEQQPELADQAEQQPAELPHAQPEPSDAGQPAAEVSEIAHESDQTEPQTTAAIQESPRATVPESEVAPVSATTEPEDEAEPPPAQRATKRRRRPQPSFTWDSPERWSENGQDDAA